MAATRWCRRPPVWRGRRSARVAARWLAVNRRRAAFGLRARDVRELNRTSRAFWRLSKRSSDPLTRGDPTSPLRWTCRSRAKLAALSEQGWRVSSTTVGRLLHRLGYRLQSERKRQGGTVHPDRNEQFEHINATADRFLITGQPVDLGRHQEEGAGRRTSRMRVGNGSRRRRR